MVSAPSEASQLPLLLAPEKTPQRQLERQTADCWGARIQVCPVAGGGGGEDGTSVWPLVWTPGNGKLSISVSAPRLEELFIELEARWVAASGTN